MDREERKFQETLKRIQEEEEKKQKKAARQAKSPQEGKGQSESSVKAQKNQSAKPKKNAEPAPKPHKSATKRNKKSDPPGSTPRATSSSSKQHQKEPRADELDNPIDDSAQSVSVIQWKVGQEVEANDPKDETWEGKYFNGQIKAVNSNGTYHVTFNDGDARKQLEGSNIRHRPVSDRERKKMEAFMKQNGLAAEKKPAKKHVLETEPRSKTPKANQAQRNQKNLLDSSEDESELPEEEEESDESDSDEAFKVSSPKAFNMTSPKAPKVQKAPKVVKPTSPIKKAANKPGEDMSEWIECMKCQKWRCWRTQTKLPDDDVEWHCALNSDSRFNSCALEQEASDAQIDIYIEDAAKVKAKKDAADLLAQQQAEDSDEEPMFAKPSKRVPVVKPNRSQGNKRTAAEMQSDEGGKGRSHAHSNAKRPKEHKHEQPAATDAAVLEAEDRKPRTSCPAELMIFDIPKHAGCADTYTLVSRFGTLSAFQMSIAADGESQMALATFEDADQANFASLNLNRLSIDKKALRCIRRFKPIQLPA